MNAFSHRAVAALALVTCLSCLITLFAQAPDKPLSEQELTVLISAGIDEAVIVARINKAGVSFDPAAALDKLKAAGAKEGILAAVKTAGQKPAPAAGGAPAVTYEQLLTLVKVRVPDEAILASVAKSPTKFVFDARQVDELKAAGASDALLAALGGAKAGAAAAAGPVISRDVSDLAIILDCSGSMREAAKEGESKMDAAKRVVADLVQKIPNGVNVAFVIYGHEVFGGADDARNCQAVKVARPLSPLDAAGKSDLAALIGGLKPTGATPIALSLRTAGEELAKSSGLCGIVLVTDGIESCKGDPAAEAAALAAKLKLTFGVNVVSFGLIRVKGTGAVKQVLAVPAGTPKNSRNNYTVQETTKYGELMIVTAGKYDIYVDENLIEAGLTVAAGKLYELE